MSNILKFNTTDSFLFINDVHISRDQIPVFEKNWNEAVDICIERKIKYIVVGGDLFQARDSQTLSVLRKIQESLELSSSKGITVILTNGNHDKVNQEDEFGYCHLYKYMPDVIVVDTYIILETPHANIFVLAYFPETGSLKDKVEDIYGSKTFSNKKDNILYAHAGVLGSLGRENKDEVSSELFAKFDRVYMGHYHNRSQFGKNIWYIGSSRQYNYGEDDEKGYNVCDSYGELTFIQNKVNTRFADIKVDIDEISKIPSMVKKIRKKGDMYRIKCTISVPSHFKGVVDKDAIKKMGVNRVEINNIFEPTTQNKGGLYKKFDKEQVVETYSEYCNEINVSPDLGVKYLNK